jgi:trehalose/maltose hydrolase-like predicted phosphorylase
MAARLDLDDLTGSTASGLHLATMGGLWQALVLGVAGVRPRSGRLLVDPRLPPEWAALEVGLMFHEVPLRLRIDRDGVGLDSGPELELRRLDHSWEVGIRSRE